MKLRITDNNLIEECALAFTWIAAEFILNKTSIISVFTLRSSLFCPRPPMSHRLWKHSKNNLERSWDSQHVDILVRACIVFFDLSQNKCSFLEAKGCDRVFSYPFVFHAYIFGPCQCLNGGCRSVLIAGKYMQHILKANRIWTFDWIFIIVFTLLKIYEQTHALKQAILNNKIHSWQCIKLRIPSFCLNVTIGGSICIMLLKTIYFNNHIFEFNSHPTRLPLLLSFELAINQAFGNNAYETCNPKLGILWWFFISQRSHTVWDRAGHD